MTKIKNKDAYPVKIPVATDYIIGSDSENDGKTVNFQFDSFVDFINSVNGTEIISYTFRTSPIQELDENGYGYFLSENNNTQPELVTKLITSKKTKTLYDLSPLFSFLSTHSDDFIFQIRNLSNPNNLIYLNITSIEEDDFQFVFSVNIYRTDNYIGNFVNGDIYVFIFEQKSEGSGSSGVPISNVPNIVYGTNNLGNQTIYGINTESLANNVVIRTSDGQSKSITLPNGNSNSSNEDLANRGFVNDLINNVTVPDATNTVKGKLKLTNDLGGTADLPQIIVKTINSVSIKGTGDLVINKTFVGLPNVDNTSDVNKPISTATQTALDGKLDKVTGLTTEAQAYVKRADGTQIMFNIHEPSFEFIYGAPAYGGSFDAYAFDKNTLSSNDGSIPSSLSVKNEIGINSIATAYVETSGNNSTAQIGNSRKAYLTIDAALDALSSNGGIVKIGIGSFSSPTSSKIKSNIAFIGSKEPKANTTTTFLTPISRPTITSPTKLENGTILTGIFDIEDKDNIRIENLGVDVGKTWCDAFNSGVAAAGIVINSNSTTQSANIIVNNVTVLGYSANSTEHCMLFQNVVDSQFSNITTYYNVHGVVLKGTNLTLNGLNAHSHANDALIIKSDTYALTGDVSVSNVNITSLSGYEGSGIILEEGVNNTSILRRVSLNNINFKYTKFGIRNINKVSEVNLSNINVNDVSFFGILLDSNTISANISNVNITNPTSEGLNITSSTGSVINISNSIVNTSTGISYSLNTSGTGLINIQNSNSINSTASYQISGTGVYGSSNIGNGTYSGLINFKSSSIYDNGNVGVKKKNPNSSIDIATPNIANSLTFDSPAGITMGSAIRQLAINSSDTGGVFDISLQARTNGNASASLRLNPLGGNVLIGSLSGIGDAPIDVDSNGNLKRSTSIPPTSGTYTPTLTNNTNTTGLSLINATYTRIGNIVTVNVGFQFTATTANTGTVVDITLPINRISTNSHDIGSGSISTGTGASLVCYPVLVQTTISLNTCRAFLNPITNGGTFSGAVNFQYSI